MKTVGFLCFGGFTLIEPGLIVNNKVKSFWIEVVSSEAVKIKLNL
jgi:hypothetical protein